VYESSGDLRLLQFLMLNRCPYDEGALAHAAARSGSTELFTWLLDSGTVDIDVSNIQYSWFIRDCLIAAVEADCLHMCKHLLQLLDNTSLIATERVAYAAAKTRNKQLLQWLVTDSGLTISDAEVFAYAANVPKQDLATVLWLLEQGYTLPKYRYTGT
jgi:hypothetical protein